MSFVAQVATSSTPASCEHVQPVISEAGHGSLVMAQMLPNGMAHIELINMNYVTFFLIFSSRKEYLNWVAGLDS